jgi:hypothetical protein
LPSRQLLMPILNFPSITSQNLFIIFISNKSVI